MNDIQSFIKLLGIAFHYYTDLNITDMEAVSKEDKDFLRITFSDDTHKILNVTNKDILSILNQVLKTLRGL